PPATRVSDKVMIPQDEYPEINFVGLLIGPRGKGSVKEGKVGRKDGQMLPGEDEPLHALVTANTMENVKKANRPPWMSSGPTENRSFPGMGGPTGPGGPQNFPPPMPSMGGPPMPPNPNGLPPPWMQPPPPPMGQGPGPHGHPMGKN
ncbi:Splicing factor 1, partial [Xenoophorus captivus]